MAFNESVFTKGKNHSSFSRIFSVRNFDPNKTKNVENTGINSLKSLSKFWGSLSKFLQKSHLLLDKFLRRTPANLTVWWLVSRRRQTDERPWSPHNDVYCLVAGVRSQAD